MEAREILDQLRSYTIEVAKFLGVSAKGQRINSYGPFDVGMPNGAITHYTASNSAVTTKNPYGRIPVLLTRFMPGGAQGVGVQFIVWDRLEERFTEIRKRYSALDCIPSEIFFFGDKLAFWHAGWANRWAYGIEIRNCGQLMKSGDNFFWGKIKYSGREPVKIGNSYWEPFTRAQMVSTLLIHRWMASLNTIRPERFLGHVHVSNTRVDPGPHFPIDLMREYALFKKNIPIDRVAFLNSYSDNQVMDGKSKDPLIREIEIHEGKYRDARDGVPIDAPMQPTDEQGEAMIESARKAMSDSVESSSVIKTSKQSFQELGYYVSNVDYSVTPDFIDTVKIFQARWKKRVDNRFVQELAASGELNKPTLDKLKIMVSQFRNR